MQNPNPHSRMTWLQNQVGKPMTVSPSPFAHWLNGTLLEVKEEGIRASFKIRKDMTNPMGMLHGGVIAGIFDDLMGVTFFSMDTEYFFPTIDLSVAYFSSPREGDEVIAQTQVIKKGENIIYMEAFLYSTQGKLLAKGNSNIVKSHLKI
ncbi:MAG: PaaI family thioesterase [Cytophagales bacterium]|nr:MAG: PaaI family thioesterase [Cytophagales bacterium]